jgi:hypothetical protein
MKFRGEVQWYEKVEAAHEEAARLKLLERLNDLNPGERLQVEPLSDESGDDV